MTTTTDELVEVLNDLVKINNDRIAGYEKASAEARLLDVDLHAIFNTMADKSRRNVAGLTERISELGGQSEGGTTAMGKLYRGWMDLKATFSGKDRTSVLESCEFGEDAAQKAYAEALETKVDIDVDTRQLITTQKADLKEDHDQIKRYRDINKSMS